jgi:hypothetical protein
MAPGCGNSRDAHREFRNNAFIEHSHHYESVFGVTEFSNCSRP